MILFVLPSHKALVALEPGCPAPTVGLLEFLGSIISKQLLFALRDLTKRLPSSFLFNNLLISKY